jgi:hypothetical protein
VLLCAAAVIAAGCHHNNNNSGYGVAWVSLTDTPGDFTSYIVNVDSVTLTGAINGVVTAVGAQETVDFTKLNNISELWSAATVPNDEYTSATITLDYTDANISVMVNGVPTKANVIDPTGAAVTTVSVTVNFDPGHPLIITPTYATTNAERLAIDFNLAASGGVSIAGATPIVVVRPYLTVATSAGDHKPIRIRGPLINSSLGQTTYTVYVRPFFDEVNSLGSLSLFVNPDTIFTIDGNAYVGAKGLDVLSQLSAGTTMTAAYTTYTPTLTPSTTAGKFFPLYVVAGSTLEDFYTEGLEGDVIARSGNTLTVRGATLFDTPAEVSSYINTPDAVVLLGPGTLVTADDNATLTGLSYKSISVGQHIIARGIYSLSAAGVTILDATGTSSTNTGSVRLISTQLWGSLGSSTAGNLVLNLQTINDWPVSVFNFAGTGASAADNAVPAAYVVNTGALALPAGAVAGGPLWIDGVVDPFGSAPPDFTAYDINAEASVPASMIVNWAAGTTVPFSVLSYAGVKINLSNAHFTDGTIRIGSESIDLKSLPATPFIVPAATPAVTPGLPAIFLPQFTLGNPVTAAATDANGTTSVASSAIEMFNTYSTWVSEVPGKIASDPVIEFQASGTYDRVSNTFTATSMNLVL